MPLSFGGFHRYNTVRACRPCNQERGMLAGLKINLFVAMHRTDARAVTIQIRAIRKMKDNAETFEKWRKIELDRYGDSITEKLGTDEYPFREKYRERAAIESATVGLGHLSVYIDPELYRDAKGYMRLSPGRAAFKAMRKFDAIAYQRWEDDGGPANTEHQ